MSKRNIIGLALIAISLICLYPGLTLPILNIHVGASIPLLGEIELYDRTQSVISGIRLLYNYENAFVATMILIFSVVIPILKALILFAVFGIQKLETQSEGVQFFVSIIGKWSMADVFVVATFLAYLGTSSDEGISSEVMEGMYFTAYCIINTCYSSN